MLTDLQIKKFPVPEHRREVPDGKISGLYLIVQPTGVKSWALRYRSAGAPKKLTIGSYPTIDLAAARKKAQEALREIAIGNDPAAAKAAAREASKAAETTPDRVEAVAAIFIERYVQRSGNVGVAWGAEIARMFKVEILPALGAKRIEDVKKRDVVDLLDAIADRGSPITSNRCLAVLRPFFKWARDDRELVAVSPCDGVKARVAENKRERVLSDDEIHLAWRAFDAIGWPFGPICKLLLLTGARRGEIAGARWSEIDFAARTFTIPGARTKNGKAHVIPLSDDAVGIIKALPRMEGKAGLVFSSTGRTPVSGFSNAKEAIDASIAKARGDGADPIEDWVMHDLRRTLATNLQKLGVRLEVTEAVLNHSSGSRGVIVGVYQRHDWAPEKRAALDGWARRLDAIVNRQMARG